MQELTDEQCQEQFAKLKKLDEYAKSLGFTIFRIDCQFEINGEINTLIDTTLNRPSKKYLERLMLHPQ